METYINILEFNCNRLEDKLKTIFNVKRNKRGIIDGLGSIIKTITGNLDASDGQRYEQLFTKINKNQEILQQQNFETIKLNKEMISKFNLQMDKIKHNEIVLKSRIMQMEVIINENIIWQNLMIIKDIINQLILLTINLIEIISEIETSLTFCNLNKIHSSIINLEDLEKITKQISKLSFWDIAAQITSHCKLENNIIEYLLEIPVYENHSNKLLQVTPVPLYIEKEMYMLDINKELIIEKEQKLIKASNCIRNDDKYLCKTNYLEINQCISNIIKNQQNEDCMYHKIYDSFVVIKIENSNTIIIAASNEQTLDIHCQTYQKHKTITGIYKFKTNNNCIINNYVLENFNHYNKEIIFENVYFKLETKQLSNKTLELKQIDKHEIKINEIPKLENLNLETNNHSIINSIVISTIVIFVLIITVRKCINIYKKKRIPKQTNIEMSDSPTDKVTF